MSRELTADERKWLTYAGLGLVGYMILRNLPSLSKGLITTAVDTTAQTAGSAAYGAGQATVEAPAQVVGQFAQGVYQTATNPALNPLYDFGAWIGGAVYDVFHPALPSAPAKPAPQGMGGIRTLRRGPDGVYR